MKLTDKEIKEAARALLILRGMPENEILSWELGQAEQEIRRHEQVHDAMDAGKLVAASKEAKAREQGK